MADFFNRFANLLWRHENLSDRDFIPQVLQAIKHFESLKPADGPERMLAEQMVGTHLAALECLRRAALPNQTFEGRDMALKHGYKLMSLYARQLETLNKHRGKGQQKVTVEHVNVEKGGQAIVGNVETDVRRESDTRLPELDHNPDEAVSLENLKVAKARFRKRK